MGKVFELGISKNAIILNKPGVFLYYSEESLPKNLSIKIFYDLGSNASDIIIIMFYFTFLF